MKLSMGHREEKRGGIIYFMRSFILPRREVFGPAMGFFMRNYYILDITLEFERAEIALMQKDGAWNKEFVRLHRPQDGPIPITQYPSELCGIHAIPFYDISDLQKFQADLVCGCKYLKVHISNLEHMATGGAAKAEVNLD